MAINIKINADVSGINDIKKSIDGVNNSIDELNDKDALGNFTEQSKTLKTQLKEMTLELQGLEPGTERFNELAIAAGKLKDQIADTNAVIKETAGSGVENLANGLAGVASIGIGAFQGIASAQALFGVESEELQQTLVKLQAAAGLSDALKSLGGLKDTLTNVKASFGAVGQALGLVNKAEVVNAAVTGAAAVASGAQATATGTATVASNALNVSLLANPIFLLVAAIGAVVGALAFFSEETETAEEANEKLNDELERQQGILDRQNEKLGRAASNRVKLLQAQGASSKEIHEAELAQLRVEEDNRLRNLAEIEYAQSKRVQSLNKALGEGDEATAKSIKKEYDANVQKYKDLANLDGQYNKDKEILQAGFDTQEKEDTDRQNEELKRKQQEAYKKRLEDQKNYNQARLDAARKIKDLELALLEDGREKEKAVIEEATKRELEDLQKKYGDRGKLSKTLLEELTRQETLIKEQSAKKLGEVDKKFDDKEKDDRKNAQSALNKINLDALEAGRDKEIKVRTQQFEKDKEDLDKLLSDKLITFSEYQDALEELTEKGRKDIDTINNEFDAKESERTDISIDENLKKREDLISSLGELSSVFNTLGSETGNAFASAIGNALGAAQGAIEKFKDDGKLSLEEFSAGVQAIASITQGFISAAVENNNAKLEEDIQNIDNANEDEIASLQKKYDSGIISKEQFEKASADLDSKSVSEKNKKGKEAFDKNKKLQIASAAVAGLQGAVAAFAGAMSLGPIAGPIVGGILAGAVGALTANNISKIQSTQFESASAAAPSSPNVASSPISNQSAQPSFSLFGQGNDANTVGPGSTQQQGSQNQNININSTVSVSEINAVQNRVAVQEQRSSL